MRDTGIFNRGSNQQAAEQGRHDTGRCQKDHGQVALFLKDHQRRLGGGAAGTAVIFVGKQERMVGLIVQQHDSESFLLLLLLPFNESLIL